jgi:acyl carrier protein
VSTKEERLIYAIASALGVNPASLSLETVAGDVSAWDSVAQVNMVSEVEGEFGITIPIERMGELKAIRDFLPFVVGAAA